MKSLIIALISAAVLTGCISGTAEHYRSYTVQQFQPRPKTHPMPIFIDGTEEAQSLKGRVKVIGGMNWEAPSTHEFLMEALRYNARRVGADAVILLRDASRTDWMPFNFTTTRAVTTYSTFVGPAGVTSGSAVTYVPVTHTTAIPLTMTRISALMVIYTHRPPAVSQESGNLTLL